MACFAAYLLLVLLALFNTLIWNGSYRGSYSDLFFGAPIFILVLRAWFILPVIIVIGGTLGFTIPHVAKKQTHKVVVCFGLAAGLLVGVIASLFSAYESAGWVSFSFSSGINNAVWWESFWQNIRWGCPVMSLYSMAWTGTYAYVQARRNGRLRYL